MRIEKAFERWETETETGDGIGLTILNAGLFPSHHGLWTLPVDWAAGSCQYRVDARRKAGIQALPLRRNLSLRPFRAIRPEQSWTKLFGNFKYCKVLPVLRSKNKALNLRTGGIFELRRKYRNPWNVVADDLLYPTETVNLLLYAQ